MSSIISVENLGKKYRIHHQQQERYTSLRDVIARKAGTFFQKLKIGKAEKLKSDSQNLSASQPFSVPASQSVSAFVGGSATEDFWALKDVSFEVKQGEVVGIIGRNGAGKSTLLKVLSRITEPTEGRVTLRGRVASLLEVGTGFHPELTGRENIFLNGAILGMTKVDIRNNFDAIVDFAGVEKFLDTPVKRYSSGMHVRLAFAVAAHLEPEILIIDEVLAVGDAEFQKKCLGKMQDVAKGGRTVLFVSHNMAAVQSLCDRGILLEDGNVTCDADKANVIKRYLTVKGAPDKLSLAERTDRQGDGSVRLEYVRGESSDGGSLITSTSGMKITLGYKAKDPLIRPKILIGLYDDKETGIYGLDSEAAGGLPETLPTRGTITCVTSPLNLTAGSCSMNIAFINNGGMADYIRNAIEFEIETADFYGTGRTVERGWMLGLLAHRWNLIQD
jgi:lipopolysaccharide transport system ATP-binding protein